jgi:hypothetical protein
MPMLAWTTILLFVLPCVAGVTGVYHCAQLLLEMGAHEFFAQTGFNLCIGLWAWATEPN